MLIRGRIRLKAGKEETENVGHLDKVKLEANRQPKTVAFLCGSQNRLSEESEKERKLKGQKLRETALATVANETNCSNLHRTKSF